MVSTSPISTKGSRRSGFGHSPRGSIPSAILLESRRSFCSSTAAAGEHKRIDPVAGAFAERDGGAPFDIVGNIGHLKSEREIVEAKFPRIERRNADCGLPLVHCLGGRIGDQEREWFRIERQRAVAQADQGVRG